MFSSQLSFYYFICYIYREHSSNTKHFSCIGDQCSFVIELFPLDPIDLFLKLLYIAFTPPFVVLILSHHGH